MPLFHGKSKKAFGKNVETEMHAGKPQKQALAIAYSMKRKAQHKAEGGQIEDNYESSCTAHCNSPCEVHEKASGFPAEAGSYADGGEADGVESQPTPILGSGDKDDLVGRTVAKRYSEGGKVANEDHGHNDEDLAGFDPNEFDDLALRDDLSFSETGANSGDELGDDQEDHDRKDIVARVMKSRAKKDRNPRPA